MHTKLQLLNLIERDHFGDLTMDGRILNCILEKQGVGMDWVQLNQDRIQGWAYVNIVMNFMFYKAGNFLTN
jgi:hypothetical protein